MKTTNWNPLFIKQFILILLLIFNSNVFSQNQDKNQIKGLFSMSINDLKNLKVQSASKQSEKLKNTIATLYVITDKEIEQYGYTNLQEALASVPSVYLYNPHSWVWGGQRGLVSNFSQTLLMINGREVNNLIASEGFISNQFATYNIKQIEILAGPGSAIYGANALAGVINIITKDDGKNYEGTELLIDVGSFNTKALSILFSEKITDDLKISGSGRIYTSDEENFSDFIRNSNKFIPNWNDRELIDNYENFGEYRNFSKSIPLNLKIDYKGFYVGMNYYYNLQSHGMEAISWDYTDNEDHRKFFLGFGGYENDITDNLHIKLDYYHIQSKFWGRYYADLWPTARLQTPGNIDHFEFNTWTVNSGNRTEHIFNMLDYSQDNATVYDETAQENIILQNYYASFAHFLIDQGLIDPNNITVDDVHKYFTHIYSNKNSRGSLRDKIELQANYKFDTKNNLIFGYTYDHINYVGLAVTDAGIGLGTTYDIPVDLSKWEDVYKNIKHGIFFQLNSELIQDRLWLTLGARWDYQNHFGSTLNPRSGIVYKAFKSTCFKLLYGEAFREANVFELSGDPNLEPAKLRGIEFTWAQDAGESFRNEFVFYYNKVSNFLGSVGSVIGENVSSVESQTVQGIENTLRFNKGNFSAYLGMAYILKARQQAKNEISGETMDVDLLSIPDLKASLGISYALDKNLQISLMNHFVNDYEAIGSSSGEKISIDSYNNLSFTFSAKNIKLPNQISFSFFVTVKNLLDEEYYHPNIRLSGTEKFLQNGRSIVARLAVHL